MRTFLNLPKLMRHRLVILTVVIFIFTSKASALNYYWVGGSGNWDALTHWATTSGGTVFHNQIPTAVDDVFFDANSFTGPNQTVTLNVLTALCHNMNWTAATNLPTLNGGSCTLIKLYGSLTFTSGMAIQAFPTVNFESTTTGQTITMGGKILNNVNFNGIGGGWTLQDNFTGNAFTVITLNAGAINTNNKPISAATFTATNTTYTKSISIGTSIINLVNGWNVISANNLTVTSGQSVFNLTGSTSFFHGGPFTYYDINFSMPGVGTNGVLTSSGNIHNIFFAGAGSISGTGTHINNIVFTNDGAINGSNTVNDILFPEAGTVSGSNILHDVTFTQIATISGNNTFHNAGIAGDGTIGGNNNFNDLSLAANHIYSLASGSLTTVNGTFNANGTCGGLIDIHGSTVQSVATISHPPGTVTCSNLVLRDVAATGGATFTANSSIDLGNNPGWTINAAVSRTYYWIGNSGNWSNGNHWSLTSGGPPSGCAPTPVDDVFFDANSFSLPGQSVVLNPNEAFCRNMNWTGVTNSPDFSGSATNEKLLIFGSLTFVSGMTVTSMPDVYFEATTPGQTITMAGKALDNVSFDGVNGGWTFIDGFKATGKILHSAGAINTNNQTMNGLSYSTVTPNFTRSINIGNSIITLVDGWFVTQIGMTVTCEHAIINITGSSAPKFSCASFTYWDVNFTNAVGKGSVGGASNIHDITFAGEGAVSGANTIHNITIAKDGEISATNNINDVFFGKAATISDANIFHDVIITSHGNISGTNTFHDLTLTPDGVYTLESGSVSTINGTLNANGNCSFFIHIQSGTPGSTATISHPAGNVTCSWLILKGIAATGGGTFVANNSVDLGSNSGWTINSAPSRDLYWVNNSGNWSDQSHWSLTSGGAANVCPPSPLDNVFFDANSFTLTGQTVTLDPAIANCRNMSWTGVGKIPTFKGGASLFLKIFGSLTMASGMNILSLTPVNFEATSPGKTITMSGKSLGLVVNFNGIGGGWTFNDAYSSDDAVVLNAGSINTNNQKMSAGSFNNGTTTFAKSINIGTSAIDMRKFWTTTSANMTVTSGLSLITITGGGQFNGGPFTYNDVNFSSTTGGGSVTSSGTIHDILFSNFGAVYGSGAHINDIIFTSDGLIDQTNTIHDIQFKTNGTITGTNTIHDFSVAQTGTMGGANTVHSGIFNGNGTIAGNNTFNELKFTAGFTYVLSNVSSLLKIIDKWSVQGSCTSYIVLQSASQGSFASVNKAAGQVLGYNIHMKDIHATGAASFIAYNSVDLGGNAGWSFQTLLPLHPPAVIIGPAQVCPGATGVVYHTSPVQGSIYYQWTVPAGATIVSGQGDTLIVVNFGTATSGTISVLTFDGCQFSTSGSTLAVTISNNFNPTVSIAASPVMPVCSGASVTFTATSNTNGTGTVTFNFKKNGVSAQSGPSNTFSTSALANGDIITCQLTISGGTCYSSNSVTSNQVVVAIGPPVEPSVSLSSNPAGDICNGINVRFTANAATNGTGTINYNFKINGVSVQNGSSNTYNTSVLNNGDQVTCTINISGGTCLSATTALSNTLTMNVTSGVIPTITITASAASVCIGEPLTFNASITNGGTAPLYQWKVNGSNAGANNSAFTSSALRDGDIVTCMLTSNSACAGNVPVSSNEVVAKIVDCSCLPDIPNFISPNGDGINDKWVINYTNCIRRVDVKVFNRNGSLVYESSNYQSDWMGTYKALPLPDATYYYIVKLYGTNNKDQIIKGNLTILR